ncbi:MAG: hypothetical protein SRB2_00561 [Desulfobacteraceae bacterium Eth-SRB2]|nr:MAG: hypothetical protein SRB2_00561 [Desulfobacteraceae bacterium Eth-SRB2]
MKWFLYAISSLDLLLDVVRFFIPAKPEMLGKASLKGNIL